MSYLNINLANLDELKSRRGNSTTGLIATILGLNYPVAEAWAVYLWVDSSVAAPDDLEIVGSLLGDPDIGRWIRIDLSQTPQVNADWLALSGPSAITNKPAAFPPSAHTHPSTDISDSTATGRAVMVATNAAAGRTAIGALGSSDLAPYATAAALTTGLAGKFNTPTGITTQYVRGDGSLATLPAAAALAQASATRALNSAFQISATRGAIVFYSVQIQVTASITGGQDGDLVLEIASDSGFTTGVQTLAVAPGSQVYSLAIALQGIQKGPVNVSGFVPAGYYARLRTVNNTGTPVFTYRAGQEVQF